MTWTPLRPEFLGLWVGWANQRWGDITAATERASSDASGLFEFDEPPAGLEATPSVLWASHPRFLPALVHVERVDGELKFPALIEMYPADPIVALVVNAEGIPVAGAEVEQAAPIPTSASADSYDPQARRVLRRLITTGADGRAELAAWDGQLLLRATHERLVSEVWIGDPRPMIQLDLRPTFEVGGAVTMEVGSPVEGDQRIVCQVQRGTQTQPLAVVPVSNGAWGPVTLPVLEVDRFRFRIEGWNAEVQDRAIEPPLPGAEVRLDFTLRAGFDVYTFVHDENEEPIPEAISTVVWNQDGRTIEGKSHPVGDGNSVVRGVPPGVVHIRAEAPGFVPADIGNWNVPDPELFAYSVRLVRGRRVEGRVLWNGQPVQDFEIITWPASWTAHAITPFRERSDGSFVLEAVTTGRFSICASAQGASPSERLELPAGESSPPSLVLELGSLVNGKGKVVDGATGEPLPDASIQPFASESFVPVCPWGPNHPVRRDGTFEIAGFAVGHEVVRFSAPGYGVYCAETFGRPGETIDFGLISLGKRKSLELQLLADDEVDFSRFTCLGDGAEPLPEQRFDSSGRTVIENVSPGWYSLSIVGSNRVQLEEKLVLLPDSDWHYTFPVAGKHRVRVKLDPGAELPDDAYLTITLPNPERIADRLNMPIPPEHVVEVSSLHAGEVRVELVSPSSHERGSATGMIREEDDLIELQLDLDADAQRFRVVDSKGGPQPRISLRLTLRDGLPPGWNDYTDENGECSMRPFAPGRYFAFMEHPELGYHFGLEVDVASLSEEPIPIVFAPDCAVELLLLDDLEPLGAVSCLLFEERGFCRLPVTTSDSNGLVRWQKLGQGRFNVQIRQAGYWPTDAPVEALPPGQRTEVQVRRLGDLDVSVERISGGLPGGAGLELDSLEFSASVATWIADGRVKSSTGTLALDGQGRLSLTGLPRGLYRWAIEGQEGTVEVLPGIRDKLTVLLP